MQNNMDNTQTTAQTGAIVNSYAQGQTSGIQANQNLTAKSAASGQNQTTRMAGDQKVVIGVFRSRRQAEQAVNQLRGQGFSDQEINVVSKQGQNQTEYVEDDITDGALTGGTIGGIGGLLLGAGALAIPGLGPIVAVGPIAAALSGAVVGGIAGGLIDWGIPEEVSRRYENSVRQGGILAVIRTSTGSVDQAATILRQNGAQDVEAHNSTQQ